jgi:hypothetical protein
MLTVSDGLLSGKINYPFGKALTIRSEIRAYIVPGTKNIMKYILDSLFYLRDRLALNEKKILYLSYCCIEASASTI